MPRSAGPIPTSTGGRRRSRPVASRCGPHCSEHPLEAVLESNPAELMQLDPIPCSRLGPRRRSLRAGGGGRSGGMRSLIGAARRVVRGAPTRPPRHQRRSDGLLPVQQHRGGRACTRWTRMAVAVDFDVHHGNGTQAIFEHDRRVLYASSHLCGPALSPGPATAARPAPATSSTRPCPWQRDGALFRRIWGDRRCRRSTIPPATAADLGRFRRPSPRPAGGTASSMPPISAG